MANLQVRVKWKEQCHNLKINDLMLIKEENLPPLKWKTGRVVEVHASKDGLIRVASVRSSIHKRAVTKLCKLPIDQPPNAED